VRGGEPARSVDVFSDRREYLAADGAIAAFGKLLDGVGESDWHTRSNRHLPVRVHIVRRVHTLFLG
jgi:hypothetical protein